MQTTTLLFIFGAALVALLLALFQYHFKTKRKGTLAKTLAFLRFLSLFGLLVLLINPKFSKNEYRLEKTNLVVLTDNSTSVATSQQRIGDLIDQLNRNEAVADRFDLSNYQFGTELAEQQDSLSFTDQNTNIARALSSTKEIYNNTSTVAVLLTDGNQTLGNDYGFLGSSLKFPVLPIVIGDTTRYEDLRIDQVNVNRYAFLKNKFPVELFVTYEGRSGTTAQLTISVDGTTQYRETLSFTDGDGTQTVNALLDAQTVGVKAISVQLQPLDNERNTVNNQKRMAVEVIDEKTNVAIISSIVHPDIGALIKAIESNEQRSVSVNKPTTSTNVLDEVDIFILYQPDASFKAVFDYIRQKRGSSFIIGGNKTDWRFFNSVQPQVRVEDGYPNQEISPILNPSFSKFDISKVSTVDFPPLESDAGAIVASGDADILISMLIRGRDINTPLLMAKEEPEGKKLFLFGENLWKWRVQSFRNDRNFENFDLLIGKLMLYLSDNESKKRLNLEYKRIYDGSGDSKITATYFDGAFVFDANATMVLRVKERENGFTKEIPMLLQNGFYEADLLGIPAGTYDFTVSVEEENRSSSGSFTILDFDVEQQFLSSDYQKLQQLANSTGGVLYFPSEMDSLIAQLTTTNEFAPTQKSSKNVVSLIDFRILMALIVAFLALEWFIRKYNGLI
ncbi:MAG: hypothetical protein Mars2KO_36670 [Maribacter sp.]